MRKYILYLYCIILMLGIAPALHAQTFQFDDREITDKILTATDYKTGTNNREAVHELWDELDPNQSNNAIGHTMPKEIRSFVRLKINHDDVNVYEPYTYRVNFKLTGYPTPGDNNNFVEVFDTLTVSYNPDSVNAYQDIHMKSIYGFYKVKVEILEVYDFTCQYQPVPCTTPPVGFLSSNMLSNMADNWVLEIGFARHVYDRDVRGAGSNWVNGQAQTASIGISNQAPSGGDNYLTINWATNPNGIAEPQPSMYELEWTYVDNSRVSFSSDALSFNKATFSKRPKSDLSYSFINNATRIITAGNQYKIPLIYKMGYVVYRVRLLRPDESQYKNTIYGPWTMPDAGTMNSVPTGAYYEISESNVHEQDVYNWNYQASYSEDGKSKHIISYFDGLLKSRQTVTKFNSLPDQQMVFEQFYNYEGRVGLQTLPIPISKNSLGYVTNFALKNNGYTYNPADFDNKTFSPLPAVASGAGASYYSPGNFLYGSGAQYDYLRSLPDAEGYPLVQTKLAPEDGRVTIQGGAGNELQIGNGHETKNYFMPPDENDLNRYFGINSGKYEFYEKTITRDPNKQLSFAINNNEGKIVMSGLMGFPDPANTSPLVVPDGVATTLLNSYPKHDLLTGVTPSWIQYTKRYTKPYFQETGGLTHFDHTLSLPAFSPCPGYYMNVPLSYSLRIFDNEGANYPLLNATTGSVYTGTSASNIQVNNTGLTATLDIGQQNIDYNVTYNPAMVDSAVKTLLYPPVPNPIPINGWNEHPTCLKSKNDFLKDALDNVDLNCDAYEPQTQCEQYETALMRELYPMAKYGEYRKNPNDDAYFEGTTNSLFTIIGYTRNGSFTQVNYGNSVYPVYLPLSGDVVKYRYQQFLAAAYSSQLQNIVGNSGRTFQDLIDMDIRDFLSVFNDDIAAALLPLHPEYCKFKRMYCDNTDFETRLSHISSYDEAVSLGLNTLDLIVKADDFNVKLGGSSTNAASLLKNKEISVNGGVGDRRIDNFAYANLVCQGDANTVPFNNAMGMSENDVVNAVNAAMPRFKDEYIQQLIGLYIANRQTKIAHYPVEPGQGASITCTAPTLVLSLVSPQVITYAFNSSGKHDYEPSTLGANEQGIINDIYSNGTPTITPPFNYSTYANVIISKLANCVKTNNGGPADLYAIKSDIVNYFANNPAQSYNSTTFKGGLSPAVLKTILINNNVNLDDLCNPYLIDYTPALNTNYCEDDNFYNDASGLVNGILAESVNGTLNWSSLISTGTAYGIVQNGNYSQNAFYQRVLKSLYGDNVPQTPVVNYFFKFESSGYFYFSFSTAAINAINGSNSVKIAIKSDVPISLDPSTQGTFSIKCEGSTSSYYSISARCIKAMTDGSLLYDYHFYGVINGVFIETTPINHCITPNEFKLAFSLFSTDVMDAYGIKGQGHPFFDDALRSYMNSYFKKTHSSQKYLDFMVGCNLSETYKIPSYYGYLHAATTNTSNTNALDVVDNYFRTTDGGKYASYKHFYYYKQNGSSIPYAHLYVDFRYFPQDKIRSLMDGLNSALTAAGQSTSILTYNELESGSNSANFADLFVRYIDGASVYQPSPGTIAPSNLNWNTDMCPVINNCVSGAAADVAVSSEVVKVKDGTQVYSFNRFHFDLTNAGASSPLVSAITYRYNTSILPDASRGFVSFPQYVSHINTENLQAAKKAYLSYAYSLSNVGSRNQTLKQLLPDQLKASIVIPNYAVSYSSFPYVSYFNGATGISGDLFIKGTNVNDIGIPVINGVLGTVKNSGGASSYFNTSTSNALTYNGSEELSVSTLSGNKVWYHLKHTTTKAHRNIWIDMPLSLSPQDFDDYQVSNIALIPGSERVRRFRMDIHKTNGPDIEVFGKADFDLTDNPVTVYHDVMLCDENPVDTGITCYEVQLAAANNNADQAYQAYMDSIRVDYTARFHRYIQENINDKLEFQTPQLKYITTLYGYDRAGNLMYTVPPEGVRPIGEAFLPDVQNYLKDPSARLTYGQIAGMTPQHIKQTNYFYNSLNQVYSQKTPDGGTSSFMYDQAGRPVFSQNERQNHEGKFSYTIYDEQNRVVESGELLSNGLIFPIINNLRSHNYSDSYANIIQAIYFSTRYDITHTFYDEEITDLSAQAGMSRQQNLRNRVATVCRYKVLGAGSFVTPATVYTVGLHYSYDFSGNVQTLTYDMPALSEVNQRYKRVDYDYDLYSGKVTLVSYNRSFADQYYQRYKYDDDNRLTSVQTSKDGLQWDNDARYTYYPHGPLARVNLGDLSVQGIDFAYTLQGWLKSINGDTPDPNNDPGADGLASSYSTVKPDLMKSTLYYFKNDYKPIDDRDWNNSGKMLRLPDLDQPGSPVKSLYNGNIAASMSLPGYFPSLYTNYTYDQLNRIKQADYKMVDYSASGSSMLKSFSDPLYNGGVIPTQSGSVNSDDLYKSIYTYDFDGNLQTLKRYGLIKASGAVGYENGQTFLMDDLSYKYDPFAYNNRLVDFSDFASHNVYNNDLKTYNSAPNTTRMGYDAIGNLTSDASNDISSILWSLSGKTKEVQFATGNKLSYEYDAMNSRYFKSMYDKNNDRYVNEYYVRDAGGNILAVYKQLKKYKTESVYAELMKSIKLSGTSSVDVTNTAGDDQAFKTKLIRNILDMNSTYADAKLSNKMPSFYMAIDPALKNMLTGMTDDMVTDMLATNNSDFVNAISSEFNPTFFEPLITETSPAVRERLLRRITNASDTGTMRTILADVGSTVTPSNQDEFVAIMGDHLVNTDPEVVMNAFRNNLSGQKLNVAMTQLMADTPYRTTVHSDWPYVTVDQYVRRLILPTRMSGAALASYFDAKYLNGGTWQWNYNTSYSDEQRLTAIYKENPVGMLQELESSGQYDNIVSGALGASPSITPEAITKNLATLNAPSPAYTNATLADVLVYNKFYLAEHHLYGSSRLGIKTSWPGQYQFLWDKDLTAAQNAAAVTANEFNYRRPWYSHVYNSLIDYSKTVPYGNANQSAIYSERLLGQKRYELTNHLGNVMAVVTDKVTEVPYQAGTTLPTTAAKRAALSAAYDYYPFGMLMPERYVEDQSTQCIPVTHTTYVSKDIWIGGVYVAEESAMDQIIVTGGIVKRFIHGASDMGVGEEAAANIPDDMGFVQVRQEAAGEPSEASISLASPGSDQEIRLRTMIVNNKSMEDLSHDISMGSEGIEVEIQQTVGGEQVTLAHQTVQTLANIDLPATTIGAGDIKVVFKDAFPNGIFSISSVQVLKKDVVQGNYVTMTCNTDDLGGTDYRFGFNGQQKDNEIAGVGNHLDFKFRGYDSRLARFTSVDPLAKKFPWNSTYSFSENDVIRCKDLEGLERVVMTNVNAEQRTADIQIVKQIDIVNQSLPAQYQGITTADVMAHFPNPRTPLYVRNLPANGQPVETITEAQYRAGAGYSLNVTFNVSVNYTTTNGFTSTDEAELNRQYSGVVSYAYMDAGYAWVPRQLAAGTQGGISVRLRPDIVSENGLTGAEIISHEVGWHNMAEQGHGTDAEGNVAYPAAGVRTLESNRHGDIEADPGGNEAKLMLQRAASQNNIETQ